MAEIRVLTVQQPWAWAIIHGGKTVENRTQAWTYRGPLAIHAGARWSDRGAQLVAHPGRDDEAMVFGALIGVVDLVDVHRPLAIIHRGIRVACRPCWLRLPQEIRTRLRDSVGLYPSTYRLAEEDARGWLDSHPWQPPKPVYEMTREERADILAKLADLVSVLDGSGPHVGHTRQQIGRCVHCSCGTRVQGRITNGSTEDGAA